MEVKPGYRRTEVGVIPNDWEACSVRDKGEVVTGKALAAHAPGPQRPYLRTKNVFDGRIDINDVLTMPMTDEQFARFLVRHGDVLLNEGQSIELVGRCAIYRNEYPFPCAIQNQLLRFRAREGVSGVFASYVFRHCQHTGVFARIALQTTSIAHLGGTRFERLRVAWPSSYAEQQAIAQALSDIDDLIQSLERLIAKKRDLKQAAMQQLLTGQTRLPEFSGEWSLSPLGECCEVVMGQSPPGHSYNRRDIGTPLINGPTEFTDKYPVRIQWTTEPTRCCKRGDLLLCVRGSSTGRTNVADDAYCIGRGVAAIRALGKHNTSFLSYQVIAGVDGILAASAGSTFPSVDATSLRRIAVPLPPTTLEETSIAEVLSDMDAEITSLEARLTKTRDLKQGMMQELLTGRTRLV